MHAPNRLPFAALVLLCLTACPRPPLRFGPEGEIRDPAVLLRVLDARSASVRSLKAEAKTRLKAPGQSGTVTELVAVQRPDALHLETLNFFGKPVAALAASGGTFQLYDESQATFYTGPASAENLARLLPIALPPEEAVQLLLGDVPRPTSPQARLELDLDERAYRLTLTSGSATQLVWVDTERLLPTRSEVVGAHGYRLRLGDYERIAGVWVATRLAIAATDAFARPTGYEVELRYREIELNQELEPTLFRLEPPPGASVVELDAAGQPTAPAPAPPPPGGQTR